MTRRRLRARLARALRALARRVDPWPADGHTEHVHVTIHADAGGMDDALQRVQRRVQRRL